MKKVVSFAGFDTLFNVQPFYEAVGRIGNRYDIDEKRFGILTAKKNKL